MISFFCKKCKLDQDLVCSKDNNNGYDLDTHGEYKNSKGFVEWYVGYCKKCKQELIRFITNQAKDPYFRESLKLQKQRREMANDLIQYGDPRFEYLYKDQWNAFEQQKKDYEDSKRKKKEQFEGDRMNYVQRSDRKLFEKLEEKLI